MISNQNELRTFDGQVRVLVIGSAIDAEFGVDNALNAQPVGGPSALERRIYVGLVARR